MLRLFLVAHGNLKYIVLLSYGLLQKFSFQKLTLHRSTTSHKSLKTFAIVTAKDEADNRVESTVCVSQTKGNTSV